MEFLTQIYKKKFIKNVIVMASGTAGAQAISILLAPIITRLYGPEAFGLLGTFLAIAAMVMPISALCYPVAIVLPKDDIDADVITKLSMYIAFIFAIVITIVIFVKGETLLQLLKAEKIQPFVYFIPLIIIFSAWFQINQQWLIRKKKFKYIAISEFLRAFIVNIANVGIGLFKPFASVLVVVFTIGRGMHAAILSFYKNSDYPTKKHTMFKYNKKFLWQIAKRYYDFPVYRAPNEFINSLSQGMPVLMLAAFFGPASAGFYTLCKKLLNQPIQLIAKTVGDVFYPKIAEASHRGENLAMILIKATAGLAIVGFVPFGFVAAFGPLIFEFIFGQEWGYAGEYARWLSVMMFFQFINAPCVKAIPILRLQSFLLFYGILVAFLRLVGISVGYYMYHNDLVAVAMFSIVGTLMYMFLISFVMLKSW